MKPSPIVCILILMGSIIGSAQSITLEERIKEVENNLITYVPVKGFQGWNILDRMQFYKVPGLSIAVINNFKIDWTKGYGWADTTKKIPVTTETMFSAGSISKLVAALTALRLAQEGKLHLDTPINKYLTSWKIADNAFTKNTPVTLRRLLSHTAGTSQSAYFGFTPSKRPLPTVVEILSGAPRAESRAVVVNSEPAKEFRYSGGGSMVAQLAMMDVLKQDFALLTQKIVFDKLGMNHSTFEQPLPSKYTQYEAWACSAAPWFRGMPYIYPQQAAAGLYTTPTDLAKVFIDIQKSYKGKGKILNKTLARQMLTAQVNISDGGYKEQMGIGPFLIQRTDNKELKGVYFEFTGVNAGFLAYGIGSVTEGNGVIIMLNSGDDVNGLGKEIRRAVAKTYNWYNFLPDEITPLQLDTAILNQYTGRYRRGVDEVVSIRREKTYLVENVNEGADIYCFPIARDTIVFTDYNIKGNFQRDKKGQVISLQTVWQDKPMLRMGDKEWTPGELLRAKRYSEAKEGYRQMKLNEYQITYLVYELLNKQPSQLEAAKVLLELAEEQHTKSAIVYSRWGEYYLKLGDKANAIKSFQKVLDLDPKDEQAKEILSGLLN